MRIVAKGQNQNSELDLLPIGEAMRMSCLATPMVEQEPRMRLLCAALL
jgi:hypothetical protein